MSKDLCSIYEAIAVSSNREALRLADEVVQGETVYFGRGFKQAGTTIDLSDVELNLTSVKTESIVAIEGKPGEFIEGDA